MYKISNVKINGFWQRLKASCTFNNDVNIIIGRNGSGKTTFMDILHSILSVDIDGLNRNDFSSAEITLKDNEGEKVIKVQKIDSEERPIATIEYNIDGDIFNLKLISIDDRNISMVYRRKALEESSDLKEKLYNLVALSSLSVYRLRNYEDFELRDKSGFRNINSVDYKLSTLMQGLTKYQLELSQIARNIANELQKEVLTSILYNEEDVNDGYQFDFDKEKEKRDLISAYKQLNVSDSRITKKIIFHINKIDETLKQLKLAENSKELVDFRPIEALRKTQKIIKMSLKSEEDATLVFKPINNFLEILKNFIKDKSFVFENGELIIQNRHESIPVSNLSSGEKQLLIIFIETLLQKEKAYIFLTDEPELSLHIEWQRNIIPAVKALNPNAQIIAATHSPEVAAKYSQYILDMKGIIND
ncbi:AAA family ATPase [Wohlfahrtiimonas chitiniclastica]|uniref:AAA family ATPase n=1 Tax=Wohlfahrtiimonas chitiniclastica TaxID=400946 RepID=UPI001BCC0919|nr:AAA family ATPase [Wohlfahrtiimonas chitiniclastica]MBS7815950.1 AAA family ATPase [Wohlfahrtiimonas chitiniclastica]MBS7822055.1 AAA family ATPase [Wohlfahrtiimonas chitiniclastica]MBS7829847.1 AAA family ATPase [Wohlfahrtiimonas chitiniclastica]MBS7831814.1 AAA family ATPase [Wohlfahrtiimonas chitiniclastica]